MSTAQQADEGGKGASTDAAHRQQKDDPAEGANVQDGRVEKQTPHGQGVDETGKDSKAPHAVNSAHQE